MNEARHWDILVVGNKRRGRDVGWVARWKVTWWGRGVLVRLTVCGLIVGRWVRSGQADR